MYSSAGRRKSTVDRNLYFLKAYVEDVGEEKTAFTTQNLNKYLADKNFSYHSWNRAGDEIVNFAKH